MGQRFKFGVVPNAIEHGARKSNVVGDHPHIAVSPYLLQRQPHLEGTKAARVLRTEVEVVDCLYTEVIVGRVIREGVAQF